MCVAIIPATIANLLVLVTLLVTFMIWPFYTPETHYAPNVGPGSADAALYSVIRESFVETTDGIRLHVNEAGPADGRTLLFLHGFPESGQLTWKYQIPYFANLGYHVIAPDQRGYNTSDKPEYESDYTVDKIAADAKSLLKKLNKSKEKPFVIGHDWGGMITWTLAYKYPELFDSANAPIVLINMPHPYAYVSTSLLQLIKSWYMFFFRLPAWLVQYRVTRDDFAWAKSFMIGSSNKGSFSKYDVSRLIEKWSIPGELTSTTNWYRATFSSLTNPRSSDIMRNNITIPVKMIFGVNDPYFAPGMQYTTATRVNNYELVEFNDATHWITHEKPDAVNAEIEKFLNKRSAISLGKSTPNNAQDEQSATEIKAGQKAPTAEVV